MLLLYTQDLRSSTTRSQGSIHTFMYFKARDGFLPPGTPCDFQFEIRRQSKKEGWKVAVQIGTKPDSGFDDPIGMLKDCHRRIEHFLDILFLVAERAHARALTGEERSAVQAALQYFHVGGERHNADEEEFPREVATAQDTRAVLVEMVRQVR